MSGEPEQRRKRYDLSLPLWVCLRKRRGNPAGPAKKAIWVGDTSTENISTGGCYFLLSEGPVVGSKAELQITWPPHLAGGRSGKVQCQGKVIRVEERPGEGKFGVACSIDQYWLLPGSESGADTGDSAAGSADPYGRRHAA